MPYWTAARIRTDVTKRRFWHVERQGFEVYLPLCRASSRRVAANSCGAMSRRGSPCTQRSLSRSRSMSCVSRTHGSSASKGGASVIVRVSRLLG
jgi:hypothetical protein